MSLGFIGIALGGWFYGRVASTASGLLARCTTQGALVIYSIVVMALFSGMRSILELILVSYVVLAWVGLSHLFIKLRHAKVDVKVFVLTDCPSPYQVELFNEIEAHGKCALEVAYLRGSRSGAAVEVVR